MSRKDRDKARYQCPLCNRWFWTWWGRDRHVRIKHPFDG